MPEGCLWDEDVEASFFFSSVVLRNKEIVLHLRRKQFTMKSIVHFVSMALLAAGFPWSASAAGLAESTIPLEDVLVTGTRIPVPGETLAVPVSVVNRQTLDESGETHLLEVLSDEVPGLLVTSRGVAGYGSSTDAAGNVVLRGMPGSAGRVLMLIDGHPQYAAIYGHPVSDAYLAADAEKVEVSRAASSVLYGSNAMGGAVNVITRQPAEGSESQMRLAGGSYGQYQTVLTESHRKNGWTFFAGTTREHADGHRPNAVFDSYGAMGKVGHVFSDKWKMSTNVNVTDFRAENPGSVTSPMVEGYADVLRGMAAVSADHAHGRFSGSANVFYDWGNHFVDDGFTAGGTPRPYKFHSTDFMGGVNLYEAVRLSSSRTVTLGGDAVLYGGNAFRDPVKEIYADHEKLYDLAAYVFLQQQVHRFSLTAGLRLDHHELYGNEWVPQFGVAYASAVRSSLKLSASKGFRTPNLKELYMYAVANEQLMPETCWNYDLTWVQYWMADRLQTEVDFYLADGDNLVEVVVTDGRRQNRNAGSYLHKGVEFSFNWQMSDAWRLHGNYSYLHMQAPVTGGARHHAFAELEHRKGPFAVALSAQTVDKLCLVSTDRPEFESYTLLNMNASYRVVPGVRLFVKGENLLAREYAEMAGFPMPRATFSGGVSCRF